MARRSKQPGFGRREGDLPRFGPELDAALRNALERGEIQIVFQPQLRMRDGAISGVEALARWQHPEHGELSADVLFAVAARSNFIGPLSAHIQRRAACMAVNWPEALAALRLSLNVCAQDLAEPDFAERFRADLAQCGISPKRVTAEITESEVIEDLGGAALALDRLRGAGIKIELDDFGTGYSSLAYLTALPLDAIKIDRSVATGITNAREGIVVRGVIDIAHRLGLEVVAEGVETEKQRRLLGEAGVSVWQGFLCAPPLSTDALVALVTERASPAPSTVAMRH